MKKVLFIDDDALVRMFLRQIIPWESEGFTVVGDARDGEEALALTEQTSPDLILSDVSMPTLDGVELVRRLRGAGFQGGIIMLSCHDDFEYVKNAMQLGADEYLLKNHLSPESLRVALQTVAEKRGSIRAAPALEKLAQKGKRALQQETIEQLLTGDREEAERQLLQDAGFKGQYSVCTAIFLQVSPEANGQNVFDLCCQIVSASDLADVEAARAGRNICAFLLDLTGQPSEMTRLERARTLSARVELGIKGYLQLESTIGISRPCSGTYAVSEALRQAKEALAMAFYGSGTYWFGSPECEFTEQLPDEAERFLETLPTLLSSDSVTLETAYAGTLATFATTKTAPGAVLRWLQKCDAKADISRAPGTYTSLVTLEDYKACVEEFLSKTRLFVNQSLLSNLSPQIAAAVRYLQTHFSEPITLSDTAAAAGFHPSYFSTVFKQELGVGFADYLIDLRLSWVRRELLENNRTIKDIAQRAGFLDYRHFCKTFKKKTGLSPAEYRKQSQK